MKVSEAAGTFFIYAEVERRYAAQSMAKTRDCFAAWILPALGEIELGQLTLKDTLNLRQATAAHRLSIARHYSIVSVLRSFLGFCGSVLHANTLRAAEIAFP